MYVYVWSTTNSDYAKIGKLQFENSGAYFEFVKVHYNLGML